MGQALAAPSHRVRTLISEVVHDMADELDAASATVSEAIHEHCPGLQDDLFPATNRSTRANLGVVTSLLRDGAAPADFAVPEEALAYARSYVHEGLSLDVLTRVYREGQRSYSRIWLDRLRARAADADELADSMGYFSDWMFAWIEAMNQPLSEVYVAEHERWIRGGLAMRSEEVRAILAGAPLDPFETSSRLRYRLDARHVGFVIWNDELSAGAVPVGDGHRVFREMDRVAGEVAEALGATSFLSLPIGRYYAGWAAVAGEGTVVQAPACRDGLRLALGRPGRGVEGFRRSHHEALEAKRIALLSEAPALSYGTVALDALMTQDLDEARRFVHDELGALLEGSDATRRLAATLEVFLHEESSFVRAARRLGVHENTVAYRVRRAEELLGRRTGERQLELRTALRLRHVLEHEAG